MFFNYSIDRKAKMAIWEFVAEIGDAALLGGISAATIRHDRKSV